MGTRALIHFKKYYIAVHWDGYPSGLGKDLENVSTLKNVLKVAKKHRIDGKSINKEYFRNWSFDYFYDYKGKGKWDVNKE